MKLKKGISLILSLLLLFSLSVPALGAGEPAYETDDPVIIVPGYGGTPLFRYNEDGSYTQVWGWNIFADMALPVVKEYAPALLAGAGALTLGQAQVLGRALGKAVAAIAEPLRCGPDGSSVYPVGVLPNEPETARWDHLKAAYGDVYAEAAIGNWLREDLEDENLFNYFVDFRLGAVENAARLDAFITKVKAYTGKDKVRLYAISHGGQVTATYLTLYGHKGDVRAAVMISPAIHGAGFAYDFINGKLALDEELLVRFIECAVCTEYDFEWLVKANRLGFADDILNAVIPYAHDAALHWQSLWDFIPEDEFDGLIKKLDPVKEAALINSTTYFHKTVMPRTGERLRECLANGTRIAILAGTGNPIVTGYARNSDAIITAAAATGAVCAPFGQRFADGYTPLGTVCADETHLHVSPSMEIDASTAFLPENTWFIDGFFHGFTTNEPQTSTLAKTLLFTDEIADVHTDPAYPQFLFSENKAYSVAARFDKSAVGYVSGEDRWFTVTNLSGDKNVRILSVRANGAPITFSGDYGRTLAPHEEMRFAVNGDLPSVSMARMSVTVTYLTSGSVSPLGERTLDLTVMNGEKASYDPAVPLCAADFTQPLGQKLGGFSAGVLKKLGLFDLLSMFYNICLRLLGSFGRNC